MVYSSTTDEDDDAWRRWAALDTLHCPGVGTASSDHVSNDDDDDDTSRPTAVTLPVSPFPRFSPLPLARTSHHRWTPYNASMRRGTIPSEEYCMGSLSPGFSSLRDRIGNRLLTITSTSSNMSVSLFKQEHSLGAQRPSRSNSLRRSLGLLLPPPLSNIAYNRSSLLRLAEEEDVRIVFPPQLVLALPLAPYSPFLPLSSSLSYFLLEKRSEVAAKIRSKYPDRLPVRLVSPFTPFRVAPSPPTSLQITGNLLLYIFQSLLSAYE